MFSDNANMPGIITGGKRAKVNAFVHSAKIEVNEKGTKAGAATGMYHIIECNSKVFLFIVR